MFGKRNGSTGANAGSIDCLIGAKTRIEGDILFEGGLRVDGQIKGNLRGNQNSMLIISEQASLEGEIHAAHAVINGKVVGTVHAADRLELQPKARITGDVHYRTLEMHPGAVVEGRLVHQGETEPDPVITLDIEAASALKRNRKSA
jgi:cytoskeletal protein CcmA (bactofilin family)